MIDVWIWLFWHSFQELLRATGLWYWAFASPSCALLILRVGLLSNWKQPVGVSATLLRTLLGTNTFLNLSSVAFVVTRSSHTFILFVFPHKFRPSLPFSYHQTPTRRRTGQQLEQKTQVFYVLHKSPGYSICESHHRPLNPFHMCDQWNHKSVHPVHRWRTDRICEPRLERASSLNGSEAALIGLFVTFNRILQFVTE